jgi:hypothetical protein
VEALDIEVDVNRLTHAHRGARLEGRAEERAAFADQRRLDRDLGQLAAP